MTQRSKQLIFALAALALGALLGVGGTVLFLGPRFPSQWFALITTASDSGVPSGNSVNVGARLSISYSDATITRSDIPALDVTALSGKAKFLADSSPSGATAPLGYIVTVSGKPVDKSKIPDKYKKEKVIPTKAGPLTALPLDEATFETHFVFRLLDRDGFELLTVESPKHDIQSGRTSDIQAQTNSAIPAHTAAHTAKIALHMVVDKCLSATSESTQ
jgi:hypothetical protein